MSVKEKMTALADVIRAKTGGTDKLSIEGMIEAVGSITGGGSGVDTDAIYNEGYEQGKADELTMFWEIIQDGGNRNNYGYTFRYGWNDENYNPLYPIQSTSVSDIFYYSNITDTKVPIIPLNKTGGYSSTFYNCKKLKIVREMQVFKTQSFKNTFTYCESLEELNIVGTIGQNGFDVKNSPKLSKGSLSGIINALSSTTTGLTVTLSLMAVNKAFETAEGANDGSTSEEWLNLVATKENWTIALE